MNGPGQTHRHTACNFPATDIGEKLLRKAVDINNCPLTDQSLPEGERFTLQHLFTEAIGLYKNPQSHRNVSIAERTEAIEMIILDSHLLRISTIGSNLKNTLYKERAESSIFKIQIRYLSGIDLFLCFFCMNLQVSITC